jgi:hypothetical protein
MHRRALELGLAMALVAAASDCGAAQRRRARRADQAKPTPAPAAAATPLVSRISTLKSGGGRLDWHADKIAFDMAGPDGRFDIYVMRPDGSGERCLTCNHPDLPKRNIGQPAWHPAGR